MTGLSGLMGCGSPSSDITDNSIIYERSMELEYAENYSVDYYEGGYKLLKIKDGTEILLVPEEAEIPSGLSEDVIVLRRPVKDLYLVSSAVMDMFAKLDALDTISLSGQKSENWYIDEAREYMERGDILYAGKYNRPDYELIVSEGCSLVIENSMILHSPEVLENLKSFDIPSMIEYSSYETHPLGRVEWVKFFGALTDREEEAEKLFREQAKILEEVSSYEKTDLTVAFFYITSNGMVQIRRSSDYVPKMIELAGGSYLPVYDGEEESARTTMNMQVEEFYAGAKDADFIIYNSSIDGGVTSIEEIIEKCPVLEDFKAVKNGDVWCTTNDMYQQSMSIGYMIADIHNMLHRDTKKEMRYLIHLR
jgi:iron complex transport system substrate-binding protein